MFRKLLFAAFALFTAFSFSSCEIWDDEDDDDSNWSTLCKENDWLYEFPEFTGNYSYAQVSNYDKTVTIELDGVEDGDTEWERYAKRLENNGFKKEDKYKYSKTLSGIDYEVRAENGMISIRFSKVA